MREVGQHSPDVKSTQSVFFDTLYHIYLKRGQCTLMGSGSPYPLSFLPPQRGHKYIKADTCMTNETNKQTISTITTYCAQGSGSSLQEKQVFATPGRHTPHWCEWFT